MTPTPSNSAEELFDDEEEVRPAGAASPPPAVVSNTVSKVLPSRSMRGRPTFKTITEKGEGLYRCGNCQMLKTPWRRSAEKNGPGPKKSCAEFGITADTKPCSFSIMDPLKKFTPTTFGDIGIGTDMSVADIQLTRVLLNRREEEIMLAASMPFTISDKVQFIYKNKYTVGWVESFNRIHVYVNIKDVNTGTEQIVPLPLGSVTKV